MTGALVEASSWDAYCPDCNWGETFEFEDAADQAAEEHDRTNHQNGSDQ